MAYKVFKKSQGFVPVKKATSQKEIKSYIVTLKEIEQKGKMSDDLKFAVVELRKSLEKGDYELASELSGVKSFVAGESSAKENHFKENTEYNEKVLGRNIYGLLDNINFNLAMHTGKLPSGMVVMTHEGMYRTGKPTAIHPTIKLMNEEHEAIYKKAEARLKE